MGFFGKCLVALQRNAEVISQDGGWFEKLESYLEKMGQES